MNTLIYMRKSNCSRMDPWSTLFNLLTQSPSVNDLNIIICFFVIIRIMIINYGYYCYLPLSEILTYRICIDIILAPSLSSSWKHGERKKGELQSWHYYEARTGLVTWGFRACSIKKVEVVGRAFFLFPRFKLGRV